MMERHTRVFSGALFSMLALTFSMFGPVNPAQAYPVFAQQNYATPREANGRLVCANCHLAQKPVEIEVPQSVLPDTVFEAEIRSEGANLKPSGSINTAPEGFKESWHTTNKKFIAFFIFKDCMT